MSQPAPFSNGQTTVVPRLYRKPLPASVAWSARVAPGYMPSAPVPAARAALAAAGLEIGDIDAVTSHNPFAVNDIVFSRDTGFPLDRMNVNGCSLVWGHPQGPTGLRAVIELVETLVARGGGKGLFQGCAAGDSAMAVVVDVRDARG